MRNNRALILLLLLIIFPFPLFAAGAILVDTDGSGEPVVWKDGVIHFNIESGSDGTLGTLTNDQASDLVRGLFEDWQNVTIDGVGTVALTLDEGSGLGSVDLSNLGQHFTYCPPNQSCPSEASPYVVGSARTGESPILFDRDGSMTDAVQGTGASQSILGFAGPRVVEREGGVLYITEGQAMLNGRFIDGVSTSSDPEVTIDQFKGAIFHELGHFIGLDHTQVNLASVVKYLNGDKSEKDGIPTMLPLFVDGEAQLSPHFDDKVALSLLYPSSNFSSSFCTMQGTILRSDGVTPVQGVNVVSTNPDDALAEVTSFVSGAFYTGTSSACDAAAGNFKIMGLTPGKLYRLGIELISQAFTGGSSIEPCDPPQSGFDAATVSGLFSCSSGGQVITTGTEATTTVVTTKSATSAGGGGGDSGSSSSGGCSLIP